MVYQNPTLCGLAYACRLFRQIDVPSGLDKLGHATGHCRSPESESR